MIKLQTSTTLFKGFLNMTLSKLVLKDSSVLLYAFHLLRSAPVSDY